LRLVSLGSQVGQCDGIHPNGSHDFIGGQELFCVSKVFSEASFGHNEWTNVKGLLSSQEFDGNI
jgi:hypothetical protein